MENNVSANSWMRNKQLNLKNSSTPPWVILQKIWNTFEDQTIKEVLLGLMIKGALIKSNISHTLFQLSSILLVLNKFIATIKKKLLKFNTVRLIKKQFWVPLCKIKMLLIVGCNSVNVVVHPLLNGKKKGVLTVFLIIVDVEVKGWRCCLCRSGTF